MERYSVIVTSTRSSQPLRLLIPYPPGAKCASLVEEVVDRAARFSRSLSLDHFNCTLFLGSLEGPVIDHNDVLSDVIHGEDVYAVFQSKSIQPLESPKSEELENQRTVNIRIVTPAIAKALKNAQGSSVPSFAISRSATIKDLHLKAQRYLSDKGSQSLLMGVSSLDLHTHELPISLSCYHSTLEQTGIIDLATENGLVIYAVAHPPFGGVSPNDVSRPSMNTLYSANQGWMPDVLQYQRGLAMFLSSLRVFTYLSRSDKVDDTDRDRILYVFDLLCPFPPAIRALHLLLQGSVPTKPARAALSQAVFCILEGIVPARLINNARGRLLEGSRLLFGLVSAMARQLKSLDRSATIWPYTSQFQTVQLKELLQYPVPRPLDSTNTSREQASAVDIDQSVRARLISTSEDKDSAVMFRSPQGPRRHPYAVEDLINPEEMQNLYHLADMCGKASLAVYKPSGLASVAAPCLTFDEKGHLAVYTGRASCAPPGRDIVLFRPHVGEETPNMDLVEQQLAPILQRYQVDGTDVFDVLGSSQARAFEYPDEILVFCVDCSASMGFPTDFIGGESDDDDDEIESDPDLSDMVSGLSVTDAARTRATFEATQKTLSEHETFSDILGAVSDASSLNKTNVAKKMLKLLLSVVSGELRAKRKFPLYSAYLRDHRSRLDYLETLAAGLGQHEEALVDFITFRAERMRYRRWTWQYGQQTPDEEQEIALPDDLTDIPVELICPVSYEVLQDPVMTADGQTYSRQAISRWFAARSPAQSPLTGMDLQNSELEPNVDIAQRVHSWIQAHDLLESHVVQAGSKRKRSLRPSDITVHFERRSGKPGTFSRVIPNSLTLDDLFTLAFRGMKGRFNSFQLIIGLRELRPSSTTVSAAGITDGIVIGILVNAHGPIVEPGDAPFCLIKVYLNTDQSDPLFSYWARQDTKTSLASVLAKYWRYRLGDSEHLPFQEYQMWTGLSNMGDGRLSGTPRLAREKLSTLLVPEHAYGILGEEPVQRTDRPDSSDDEPVDSDNEDYEPKPLVLKVSIEPARTAQEDAKLSRMEVSKQMFDAMINRILAYCFKTHVGLVTFDTTAKLSQSVTHVVENFRRSVESMEPRGDTALWNGLRLAEDHILQYARKYPQAKRRIVCLSDGNDTKSTVYPIELYRQLREKGVAVDSICIGNENNTDLKTLSHLLGSYCFKPEDLNTALAICEMEPVLSQTERPPLRFVTSERPAASTFHDGRGEAVFTTVTRDVFPSRKEHPRLQDSFIQLADCVRASTAPSANRPNVRSTRLLVEMRDIASNTHPKYDCYVSETDISFWKVVVEGPPDTPYSDHAFLLYLEMPGNFPTFPPQGRFVTPIFHPNINRHGRICHSIFDRDWTTDTSLRSVLDTVYGLLFQAETSDAVHTSVTLGFHHGEASFVEEAREHTQRHAKKTRQEWRDELLGLGME